MWCPQSKTHLLSNGYFVPEHFVGEKKDRVTLNSSEPREEAQELFYQVWLRYAEGSREAQSKEHSCAHLGRSPLLCAVTPAPLPPPTHELSSPLLHNASRLFWFMSFLSFH